MAAKNNEVKKDPRRPRTYDPDGRPRGYRVRTDVECCATCAFGGYLGSVTQVERMAVCEINGEEKADYYDIAVEPLGWCHAYKPALTTRFVQEGEADED